VGKIFFFVALLNALIAHPFGPFVLNSEGEAFRQQFVSLSGDKSAQDKFLEERRKEVAERVKVRVDP
jgi:hypothetical protein